MSLREALPCMKTELPGPNAKALIERRDKTITKAFPLVYPVFTKRAEGAMLEDVDGNIYVDFIGGVGVMNAGYGDPELIEAVKKQSEKFFHSLFCFIGHEGYIEIAEKLNEIVPVRGDHSKVMMANGGGEAIENAVKFARAYTGRPGIVCFTRAFHGKTNLTLAMSANKAIARGVGPFPADIYRSEFPYMYRRPSDKMTDEEAIDYFVTRFEEVFRNACPADEVAAVVIEPMSGEGGFIPVPIEFIKRVRQICDEHGILLIADEVQCGNGRSGKPYISCYWAEAGVEPDILCTAKALSAGIPLGATVARDEILDAAFNGNMGGTFTGNALACATASIVLDRLKSDELPAKARHIGEIAMPIFKSWIDKYEVVGDVRGIGAHIGIEFVTDKETKTPNGELVKEIIQESARNGMLIESAGDTGNCLRFLVPLVVTDEQLRAGIDILEAAIAKCSACS